MDRIKFGDIAVNTAMDGFASSDAHVMIVHSADDDTVPIECGYDIYKSAYGDSERFKFVRFENKGHNAVYQSDGFEAYLDKVNKDFGEYKTEHGYKSMSKKEKVQFRLDWLKENLDRAVYSHSVNTELFDTITAFYIEAIK